MNEVERLKAARNECERQFQIKVGEVIHLQAERDALKAELVEVKRDAERWRRSLDKVQRCIGGRYTYFKQRFGISYATTRVLSQLIDETDEVVENEKA